MFRCRFLPILLALVGIGILGVATPAEAAFRLRLDNIGAGTGTVLTDTDGDGLLIFAGGLGAGFVVNVTTGSSKPLIGGVNNIFEMDLNSVNINVNGPGSLRITLEDDNYVGSNGLLQLLGTVGGTLTAGAGSTITVQSYVNPGNLVPALGPDQGVGAIGAIGAIPAGSVAAFSTVNNANVFGPGAFSATGSQVFTKSGPLSLIAQVTVNFTGGGTVSFDENQQILPTPAPAGLVLALTGLPFLGVNYLRRRMKRQA